MQKANTLLYLAVGILIVSVSPFAVLSAPLMVEKNLFAQDRKPPAPETMAALPQKNSPGLPIKAIQLDGVIMHGNVRKALVRIKGQAPGGPQKAKEKSPYMTVQEGEKVGEYQVVKIEPKSISLEKDGEVFLVDIFAEGKVAPPPIPTPPPQAAVPEQVQPVPAPPVSPQAPVPNQPGSVAAPNLAPPAPPQDQPNVTTEPPPPVPEENAGPPEPQPAEGAPENPGQ